MSVALETRHLTKAFGGVTATDDLSLVVASGARLALIGPNGAGKTTLVNQLTGVSAPDSGQILLDGRDITHLGTAARARLGLVRTFQINQLFASLTPVEAIALTLTERARRVSLWRGVGRDPGLAAAAAALIDRFGLASVMDQPARSLSYGKQRLLEIAIALAARPRVLLLDEPAAGVAETERHEILAALAALPPEVAILLIEHDMDLVFSFADSVAVLVDGALLVQGPPSQIMADPQVRAVYLGNGGAPHG